MKGEIVHERQLITENAVKRPDPLRPFSFLRDYRRSQKLQIILEIILGKEVLLKYLPQPEKEQKKLSPLPLHPGRRLVGGYL